MIAFFFCLPKNKTLAFCLSGIKYGIIPAKAAKVAASPFRVRLLTWEKGPHLPGNYHVCLSSLQLRVLKSKNTSKLSVTVLLTAWTLLAKAFGWLQGSHWMGKARQVQNKSLRAVHCCCQFCWRMATTYMLAKQASASIGESEYARFPASTPDLHGRGLDPLLNFAYTRRGSARLQQSGSEILFSTYLNMLASLGTIACLSLKALKGTPTSV